MAIQTPEPRNLNETRSVDIMQSVNIGEKGEITVEPSHAETGDHAFPAEIGDPDALLAGNLLYGQGDEEPEIHLRTWIAFASMLLLIYCQNMCLQGPPSVVSLN